MKGLPRSTGRGSEARQEIVTKRIPIQGLSITIADGAPGYGTAVISGLPEGYIRLLGAVITFDITKGDANIIDAFNGDFSVGTVADANGTLAGGEVDIIASTATVLGVSGVSSGNVGKSVSTDAYMDGDLIDNTAADLELNFNLLIDDASISGASSATIDGVMHISYIVLGDD